MKELEALGALDDEQLPDEIVEDQEETEETPELNAAEQKAWDGGWRPEEQFEGNPENWKTAREYNMYGEFQSQLRENKAESRRKEAEFDERLANSNKLHEARRKSEIDSLKAQRREAVEEADTDKYDKIQTQIDSHDAGPETTTPAKDPAVAEWEAKNAWINDTGSEKYAQAQAAWSIAASRGMDNQAALDFVDSQLGKLYPSKIQPETPTNPRREAATMTETSTRRSPRQRGSKELTMNDLTRDEAKQWAQFGEDMFGDQKSYLKAVSDARKEG